ncbi:MAG TPA: NAD(P)H-hydrate dehydratase [Terriglobales bacterium]|jgi:ADP-dependent NAD(P)H-hydrate dehydratase / NAD(P)H-hydrate epimerase|nr:NAD(P)H-hydrate dehydratase [Terriglobales bacterium]
MKIVSAAEMREIDRATSERFGVASGALMENAGSAVARFVLSDYPQAERVGIVCGKGNNGGDGFVVARKLVEAGRAVRVLLLCDSEELRGDAAARFKEMLEVLRPLNVAPVIVRQANELDSSGVREILAADVIVDAILGTGFRPPVSALYAAAIGKMNAVSAPIVAVDIPSGADADALKPPADRADQARADGIVTFTAPRPAHVFAALSGGPTVIAPIGSPPEAIVSGLGLHLSTPVDFAPLLAPRAREGNKGSYGHVVVIGGSLGKVGAAAMAGFAALKAGAGLSTVATPKSLLSTVSSFHPEVMTEPLPETEQGTISLQARGPSLEALLEHKTLAVGPGISRNAETAEFVRTTVEHAGKSSTARSVVNLVVDADALNAFEGATENLNGRGRTVVITPHPGEMSRLTRMSIPEIQAQRLEVARKFARQHELIVVLKGHRTLIAAPDGTVWVNPTGNPGMATGGTGDILTGMVAGLIAQHPQHALEATALAVYLHGLAGDLAVESVGENSMVATDLLRFLPEAFAEARRQKSKEIRIHA